MAPSLSTSALRIDVAGVPAVDGLTFATTGQHAIVLGAPRILFAAASGVHAVTRGQLTISGLAPRAAVRAGIAASAALDPHLPPRWTANQLAAWSARLASHSRSIGRELAADALKRVGLSALGDTPIQGLPLAAKRAAVLASALATGATTLLVEWSVAGLVEPQARALSRIFAKAIADRHTVVFSDRMMLDSPLALASDEAIVVDGSEVLAQNLPAEIASRTQSLMLRVVGGVDEFVRGLEASGGRAERHPVSARTERLRVDLGPLSTGDIFRIATESCAVVFELRPLSDVFA
jgi:ABC-type multidrug transport system ATPase subunit